MKRWRGCGAYAELLQNWSARINLVASGAAGPIRGAGIFSIRRSFSR